MYVQDAFGAMFSPPIRAPADGAGGAAAAAADETVTLATPATYDIVLGDHTLLSIPRLSFSAPDLNLTPELIPTPTPAPAVPTTRPVSSAEGQDKAMTMSLLFNNW